MTKQEAIKGLTSLLEVRRKYGNMQTMKDEMQCLDMAIKALEQEPFLNKPCVSEKVCEHDKNVVLDKIRAEITEEILSHSGTGEEVIQAYVDGLKKGLQIIDKYAESEEEE